MKHLATAVALALVQALLMLAQLSVPAGAVMALSGIVPGLEDTTCHSTLYFRLISLNDYAADVDLAAAFMLESASARNCSRLFVRGVNGMDLGIGMQLYGPSLRNYKTAQVVDFETEANAQAFLECQARQPTTALLAQLGRRTGHVKALIPASSCPQDAPGASTASATHLRTGSSGTGFHAASTLAPVMDVFALLGPSETANASTVTPTSGAALGKRLLALLRTASDQIVHALGGSTWANYDFLSWADDCEEAALVAGTTEFASLNLLRAYWAYLHGPPVVPQLTAATAAVQTVARVQMQPVQLKECAQGTSAGGAVVLGQPMWEVAIKQHWAQAASS